MPGASCVALEILPWLRGSNHPRNPAAGIPHDTEKAPVKGAFSGLLFGVIVAPMMIIVGTMLCLTGLGIFLGVPLIIGGILAPLAGPLVGFGSLKGKCPSCGTAVSSLNSKGSFECEACHQRIVIRDQKFVASA
jgi:DNA-directed RNA polymerase subunit RPC12/RpoP